MKELSNLVTLANTYLSQNYNLPSYNHVLVRDIALYITNLMKVNSKKDFFRRLYYSTGDPENFPS